MKIINRKHTDLLFSSFLLVLGLLTGGILQEQQISSLVTTAFSIHTGYIQRNYRKNSIEHLEAYLHSETPGGGGLKREGSLLERGTRFL